MCRIVIPPSWWASAFRWVQIRGFGLHVNHYRNQGYPRHDALLRGCRERLRKREEALAD